MIDKKAYQKMDYALCLLSAHADGKDSGCIINSFHQDQRQKYGCSDQKQFVRQKRF